MKIKVERVVSQEGDLKFTITVSDPQLAPFTEEDHVIMKYLDSCKSDIDNYCTEGSKIRLDVLSLIHLAKEKTFIRVLENLKFAIENEFRPMFKPICQEIYNWIYDHQEGFLRKWMMLYDPQRTTFYFDNDEKSRNIVNNTNIPEDDDEDDDDED